MHARVSLFVYLSMPTCVSILSLRYGRNENETIFLGTVTQKRQRLQPTLTRPNMYVCKFKFTFTHPCNPSCTDIPSFIYPHTHPSIHSSIRYGACIWCGRDGRLWQCISETETQTAREVSLFVYMRACVHILCVCVFTSR